MIPSGKKIAIVAVVAAVATVIGTASMAFGSVKPGTVVTGKSTKTTFTGTINDLPITVTCTSFKDSVKMTSSDKTSVVIPAPTITGCTDTLKGKDTIKTNSVHGKWELKTNSSGNTLTLVIPMEGATFTSSVVSGCVITAAPSGPVNVKGSYNGAGKDTVSKAPIAVSAKGCTASNASTTTTVTFTPNPGKIPPFAS